MNPRQVLSMVAERKVKIVDLRFMDFPGLWQHLSVPIDRLEESSFEDGFAFDGSSIRGWRSIHQSDMLIVPDPATAFIDPFRKESTLCLICDVRDPSTGQEYNRDPRAVAKRAVNYLKQTGIGDEVFMGPEAEFFIFDSIRFDAGTNFGFYHIDSDEGRWNTGRPNEPGHPNLGYRPRVKEGYFPVPPTDSLMDIRTDMVLALQEAGIQIEAHHHEVATGGQCEIGFKFQPLVRAADVLSMFKYFVKNTARKHGKTVTFMPKPLHGDNGSGMHVHSSIWRNGKNTFAGDGYAGLSETGLHAIGGILKHARALTGLTNPTTNSYKRLVPGYEAPVNLAYSSRNRSASIRIPMGSASPKSKRFEFRCPDSSSNPYFAFSAMLMAMIDGIENKIDPGQPLDKDIYDLPPEELKKVPSAPGSLDEALSELEKDHAFLLKGDVFSEDVLSTWIEYKRKKEIDEVRMRPHPYEFFLYFDI
ncbi:MAG TPA: type I glutamate--ammonia ligase [Planctomycetota bacterium]|nr:type I glutamate--ammonia ligase [Planctomycetota bacterium]